MENIPSEMLRGHIDTIILLSLLDSDKHTAQIKEEIEGRAGGFELKQGTFYSCLQRIVKQGYVTEYRTSNTPDGVRRKFYQLTEKGKIYIDENKDKWEYARQMINSLIMTPEKPDNDVTIEDGSHSLSNEVKTSANDEQTPEESLNEFLSSQLNGDDNRETEEPARFIIERNESDTTKKREGKTSDNNFNFFSYIDDSPTKRVLNYDDIIEPISEGNDTEQPDNNDIISNYFPEDIDEPLSKPENKRAEPEKSVLKELKKPSADDDEPKKQSIIRQSDTVVKPSPTEAPIEKTPEKPAAKQEDNGVDDTFDAESVSSPGYKSVLSRIFNSEKQDDSKREIDYTEGFDLEEFLSTAETVDERRRVNAEKEEKKAKKQPVGPIENIQKKIRQKNVFSQKRTNAPVDENTTICHPYYDFSDVQSMADREGFKIKISSREKSKEAGRILINKLVFHSAIIFFAILLAETLILYFTTSKIAGLDFTPYLIFIAICLVFPLSTTVIYLLHPDKKVSKIATFKSSVELIAIIMLDLLLIDIACCVLSNIDFSNQQDVFRFIVYPVMFIIDLPIYPFIKYLSLDKDNYYV